MRMLTFIDEFRSEASKAIFTKEQALAVMQKLLQKEIADPQNTEKELKQLEEALAKVDVRYVDATSTETDMMLDEMNVARLTADEIVAALENILFEVTL